MNLDQIYVTTCGRIFVKSTSRRTVKSYEYDPSTIGDFKRFCKNNKLNFNDFKKVFSGKRNKSKKRLYHFMTDKFYPDLYEVKQSVCSNGYCIVTLNGKSYRAHKVILSKLKPNKNSDKLQINHIDGNKQNNCVLNLEWCTAKENINHAWDNGLATKTEESIQKMVKTNRKKYKTERVFDSNFRGQKSNIKTFLKSRGIDIKDYQFVGVCRNKDGHLLGYLK